MNDHIIKNTDKKGDSFSEWKRKTILQTMRRGLQEIHKHLDGFFNSEMEKVNIDEYKEILQWIALAAKTISSLSDSRSRDDFIREQRDYDGLPF